MKSLPLTLVIISIITLAFYNEFVDRLPKEYIEYKKLHPKIIKKRTLKYENLIKNTEYEKDFNLITKEIDSELDSYFKGKNELKSEIRIFGYLNKKSFYLQIAFPIFSFVLLILGLIGVKKIQGKENLGLKKITLKVIYPCMFTSVYWSIWSLLWFKIDGKYDLPDWILYLSIAFSSVLIILFIKYLIKFFQNKENRLVKIINSMGRFVIKTAKKHVKKESLPEYRKDYLNALKDGIE